MRKLVFGLALTFLASGLSLAGLSFASGSSDPVWEKGPDRSDFAKAYPAHAAQAGISGAVKMRCSASGAGLLKDCAVISEAPTGEGFGAAALSLAAGMELKPTTADGKSVAGQSFIVPVKFEPGVLKPGAIITQVDWLRKPTNDELLRYWPTQATSEGGKALLHCFVTNRGLMDRCTASEDRPGHGYGGAALAMAELFVMRPMTVDGEPVGGGEINIPIHFAAGGPSNGSAASSVSVFTAAPWLTAPSLAQVAAAFPKGAVGKVASAHVLLRCAMRDNGSLENCESVSESHQGFGRAAQSLTKEFRLPASQKAGAYAKFRVDVPFDFRDPTQPAPPVEIHDPVWIQQIKPDAIVSLFPEAAIKAGYKVGRASVECTVAADGTLGSCSAVTEEPAGYGFGEAALTVAGVMRMSPWTKQGAPAEGAKIVLPIKFVQPENEPAATPAAASTPKQP